MGERIYRSERVRALLRTLHRNGPTREFRGMATILPSANAMRKLCEQGLIECVQSYRIADGRRDTLSLELTITAKGREWLCSVTGDDPTRPATAARAPEGQS